MARIFSKPGNQVPRPQPGMNLRQAKKNDFTYETEINGVPSGYDQHVYPMYVYIYGDKHEYPISIYTYITLWLWLP